MKHCKKLNWKIDYYIHSVSWEWPTGFDFLIGLSRGIPLLNNYVRHTVSCHIQQYQWTAILKNPFPYWENWMGSLFADVGCCTL